MNATRKPATVIRPAKSWACSKASGIMGSASIARMAPAATAVVAAITSGPRRLNTRQPLWNVGQENRDHRYAGDGAAADHADANDDPVCQRVDRGTPRKPMAVESKPPRPYASSIKSNESAEI